jgi:y4mF family transcriptional regulator
VLFYSNDSRNFDKNHTIVLVKEIGEQIKERRKLLGLTQPDLAELADVSVNTLYKLERGQNNPTLDILERILKVLGLEIHLQLRQLK